MDKKAVVANLQAEEKELVKQLGDVRMALRGLGSSKEGDVVLATSRKRVHLTPDLRQKYLREIVAVLEAYGPSNVQDLFDRGNFDQLSRTSVYRLALNHPQVENNMRRGKLLFSLKERH